MMQFDTIVSIRVKHDVICFKLGKRHKLCRWKKKWRSNSLDCVGELAVKKLLELGLGYVWWRSIHCLVCFRTFLLAQILPCSTSIRSYSKTLAILFLTMVHSIPSWSVWAEIWVLFWPNGPETSLNQFTKAENRH
jgi:hypothetical protein